MGRTWVLAANASRALCFERQGLASEMRLVAEFEDPDARLKGHELGGSRAGYEPSGHGGGGAAFTPRTNVRDKEHDRFALRLARHLNEAIAAHQCEALALFASNPFLGEVKSHLSAESAKALLRGEPKDLTGLPRDEMVRHIVKELTP